VLEEGFDVFGKVVFVAIGCRCSNQSSAEECPAISNNAEQGESKKNEANVIFAQ